VFDGAVPEGIWEVSSGALEPYFARWEGQLTEIDPRTNEPLRNHLNNPTIPLTFIQRNGVQVYPPAEATPGFEAPTGPPTGAG
jgi:hypothetical protein